MPEVVACRTPAEGRDGVVNVPTWKYAAVRQAILAVVAEAGPEGVRFSALAGAVKARLPDHVLARLGSVGWHVTTVKLNMEVESELVRLKGSPQRLVSAIHG
ncbi:MAG: hypothetical protein QNJ16_05805 [Rhodobacter sp.]|nr:hypothetical protein [Rhodobacter sp.]